MEQNQEKEIAVMEEPIYPGGPTASQVDAWKEEHGFVYLMEFEPGEAYIFRPVNRREFKELARIDDKDTMNREERLCEMCVLWPQGYDFVLMNKEKAGIPTLISEEIMVKSGFSASNVVEI